jgi:hypothetical protein
MSDVACGAVAMAEKPKRKMLSVKLDEDVVKLARLVATFEDIQIADLISGILRPILTEREKEGAARRYGKPKGGRL